MTVSKERHDEFHDTYLVSNALLPEENVKEKKRHLCKKILIEESTKVELCLKSFSVFAAKFCATFHFFSQKEMILLDSWLQR